MNTHQRKLNHLCISVILCLFVVSVVWVANCAADAIQEGASATSSKRNDAGASTVSNAPIRTIQEAFNRGIAEVDKEVLRVNDVQCKITIQKASNGWLMLVQKLPRTIGSEAIVTIKTNGEVMIAPGF